VLIRVGKFTGENPLNPRHPRLKNFVCSEWQKLTTKRMKDTKNLLDWAGQPAVTQS